MPRNRDATLRQVLDVAQMRAAEQQLIDGGTDVDALMQRAGRGAGEYVRRLAAGRAVTVLCGPGNNGGDGYVIAQMLLEHGNPVQVVAPREPATDAARTARALYQGAVAAADQSVHGDVLVDCLFGSGLTRPLSDDLFAVLGALAARHSHVIAIDLPSGVESDSGIALNAGLPVNDLTIALGAWKFAHWTQPAAATMGALRLIDIRVEPVAGAATLLPEPRITAPAVDAHKYRRGLLAIVAGAMPGATLLSADAALRAGAGYVRLLSATRPEGVPHALVSTQVTDETALIGELADPRLAAILIGPGLGRDPAAKAQLNAVLAHNVPCVIDADALTLLDRPVTSPAILTPHEGEMATLERSFGLLDTGLPGSGPRRGRALALAAVTGAIVVFKGPDSLIAAPDGTLLLTPPASSWLSVAGTGDVLAGMIASRLAVHHDPLRAAQEGLWLHAAAARIAGPAFTAGDLALATSAALTQALSRVAP
jgi:hydroxyethylthiazole kinase-like uncharacterized protein yjeF